MFVVQHRIDGRLTVGSLFAGVGGFDLGFERAGFVTRWQVERDADCRAVLSLRFPDAVRYVDVNAFAYGRASNRQRHGLILPAVDIVVGGFPCQDLSVAGKREGLGGSRSGLFFAFMRILAHLRPQPKVVVIENVPGLLSSQRGRDFHTVLHTLAQRGFRRAYRILDSQYFGVAQRRRRVFILGCPRTSGLDPASILFEPVCGGRNSQASGTERPRVASTLKGRAARTGVNEPGRGGEDDTNLVYALGSHSGTDGDASNSSHAAGGPVGRGISREMSHSLRAGRPQTIAHAPAIAFSLPSVHRGVWQGHNTNYIAGPLGGGNDGIGRRSEDDPNLVYQCHGTNVGPMGALRSGNGNETGGVPFVLNSGERERALTGSMHKRHDDDTDTLIAELVGTLGANKEAGGWRCGPDEIAAHQAVAQSAGVRRLTPTECERLQGFPDGWTCRCGNGHLGTLACTCPDTPRYKQLGNAVTVNVAEWIAKRALTALSESCT